MTKLFLVLSVVAFSLAIVSGAFDVDGRHLITMSLLFLILSNQYRKGAS